jgi:hypothetical protein
MKKIKILESVKASPSQGKILSYEEGEEFIIDNDKMTTELYDWFLRNELAIEVVEEKEEVKKEVEIEEKAVDKAPEDKAVDKAPENKGFTNSYNKRKKLKLK